MDAEQIKKDLGAGAVFPIGGKNEAFAQYFIGQSYLNMLSTKQVVIGNVTFEPGCRNNWHINHSTKDGGQILICVDGEGWYQEEGKEAQSLKPGDVVVIPANVKHWHGAKKNSWFSHLALEVPGENTSNEWCEPVSDEEYNVYGKTRATDNYGDSYSGYLNGTCTVLDDDVNCDLEYSELLKD